MVTHGFLMNTNNSPNTLTKVPGQKWSRLSPVCHTISFPLGAKRIFPSSSSSFYQWVVYIFSDTPLDPNSHSVSHQRFLSKPVFQASVFFNSFEFIWRFLEKKIWGCILFLKKRLVFLKQRKLSKKLNFLQPRFQLNNLGIQEFLRKIS